MSQRLCILFFIFLFPNTSGAQTYSYTDSKGASHFVDNLEKIPLEQRSSAQQLSGSISKIPARSYDNLPANVSSSSSHRIDVFVADWCSVCRSLEAYLKKKKVRYNRKDIDASAAARKEFKKLGGGGIPLLKVGSQTIRGFNRDKIDALLDKR